MPSYARGKIYTIRSRSRPDLIYVGSTIQALTVRFGKHKYKPCSSRQIIDIGDAYIELYENYPCTGKEELNRREGEVIRSMTCVNHNIPGRTKQEYNRDNAEQIAAQKKQYSQNNARHIAERTKQYQQANRESLEAYHKQYNQANRESLAAQNKQNYQSKKDIQTCICSVEYNYGCTSTKNKHYRSKKHQKHLQLILQKLQNA